MARYGSLSYNRQKSRRNWIIFIALVLAILVFIFSLKRNSNKKTQTAEAVTNTSKTDTSIETTSPPQPQFTPITLPGIVITEIDQPDSAASELIRQALDAVNSKPARIIQARDLLNNALQQPLNLQQLELVKKTLSQLSQQWLFSRSRFTDDQLCGSYKVALGDNLSDIGKKFNVPWEILARINMIKPQNLRNGSVIKVVNGPFHLRVYLSRFEMDLYLGQTFVRTFNIGIGLPASPTPKGLWLVEPGGKLIKPTWTDPQGKTYNADDPDYPLGSRWISLKGINGDALGREGFAIHGTADHNDIGKPGSQGCIRLFNEDVELVYDLMTMGQSQLIVLD